MKTKISILMGCMATVGLAFMSCSKDNLYDSNAAAKQVEAEYAANFVKKYGEINPNQTWDFATMTPSISLPSSGASARVTRGDNATVDDPTLGHMSIEQDVIQYVWDNLPMGINNDGLGRAFTMKTTGNPFTIVPIFQGCASYYWELWMWVDGLGHKKIWTKGDDFKFRKANTNDAWSKPGIGKQGMRRDGGPYEVYAPSYTYNIATKDLDMYFYLKVWTSSAHYENYMNGSNLSADQPSYSTSLNNFMLDLQNAVKPTNLPEGNEVTIIGCEDVTTSGSDRDFEDLVFMVYGKPVPPTKRVVEVIEETGKRYMMEDLGDTDDFDFNDVVVDVMNRKKITYIYPSLEATQWTSKTEEQLPQQAIIRAAGGTIDFTLTIGETPWTKSKKLNPSQMVNTGVNGGKIDPYAELDKFEVTGWDPEDNNVSVTVNGRGDNKEGVLTITFPKKGEAPKIIAVDFKDAWMTEREEVPSTWFDE